MLVPPPYSSYIKSLFFLPFNRVIVRATYFWHKGKELLGYFSLAFYFNSKVKCLQYIN